jgi:cephalosporin hydroxylase
MWLLQTSQQVTPPKVEVTLDEPVRRYVRERLRQHTLDSYAGVPMFKFPEDLRVYEHLLWISEADTVIELGVQHGGSSLWFRDRLLSFSRYRRRPATVIAIDRDLGSARERLAAADASYSNEIKLIEGDVTDPELPRRVAAQLPSGGRCFVVEDTAHEYATTWAALHGFSGFVPRGGFMIVEDGCVDIEELRVADDWPRGVLPAVTEWLKTEGRNFTARRDLELYGISCHPNGFLQRTG